MKTNYVVRKFDGDDMYSWAVFRKDSLPKGHSGVVSYGEAKPLVCGCSKMEANHYKSQYENK